VSIDGNWSAMFQRVIASFESLTRGLLVAAPYAVPLMFMFVIEWKWPLVAVLLNTICGFLFGALVIFVVLTTFSIVVPPLLRYHDVIVVPMSDYLAALHAIGAALQGSLDLKWLVFSLVA
jgi:hypothetical protein